MSLIPWRPIWDLEKWLEGDWELPETSLSKLRTPRMDIYEDNGNVVAEAELPGFRPEDINVEVKDNYLKIEGRGEEKKEEKKKGYYRKEMSRGYLKRVVPLPCKVDEKKAKAEYTDGILKVVIPKLKEKEAKKGIKIKVKSKKS
ncbi:MAG TPA: Hsp20/alpha crystallin family protein [Candidatus Parcubacteria bacterium]|nr:Hsp20/alpha crystallin family protein [Candidatus Parcubacteria bacterium]